MAPSPTIRRLLRECAELSSSSDNPSPAFYAAPVSDADLHEWHFTLLGPPSPSPYAGGLYHGRITLPPTYPLKPPNFRFLTPSGRFEVNREICLSISGFHEETWMPAWGVRTALTALRTFMAESGTAGQVGGLESSEEVRKKLAKESRSWRCESCTKTCDTIMREWWTVCTEKGVNVDEEGEMGLEVLPEGMNVEARVPRSEKGKERAEEQTPIPNERGRPVTTNREPLPQINFQPVDNPHSTPAHNRQNSTNLLIPGPMLNIARGAQSPSPEAVQASAEALLTPTDLDHTNDQIHRRRESRALLETHSSSNSTEVANATIRQELQPHLTIDRAIAGVFLALCLMVLKKIFYPANGRDMEEFYLQRDY